MKIKLLALFLLLQSFPSIAQEWTLGLDAGYGLRMASGYRADGNRVDLPGGGTENSAIIYSYGQGWNFNSEIVYSPQKSIGFGLEAGYLESSPVKGLSEDIHFSSHSVDEQTYSAGMLRLSPFVKFKFDLAGMTFYSRMGYVMGVLGKIREEYTFTYASDNWTHYKLVYSKGISHGAVAGLGVTYPLNDRLSLTGEVRMFLQAFGPRQRELVAKIQDGLDDLPGTDRSTIFTNYEDHFVSRFDPNDTTAHLRPSTALRRFYPFSSVGLNIGIQYSWAARK